MNTDEGSAVEYERTLFRMLRKLSRAHERGTGTHLTSDDVAYLFMEFNLDFDEVATRAYRAINGLPA